MESILCAFPPAADAVLDGVRLSGEELLEDAPRAAEVVRLSGHEAGYIPAYAGGVEPLTDVQV